MINTQRQMPLDSLYIDHPRRGLVVLFALYLAIAFIFAGFTPPWQAPDEPAHYNYIAHIATTGSLPMLQMGDYNQDELDILKSERFPKDRSIDGVRYENYQPPLYYLLSAIVFRLGDGDLLYLRLFNVLLGTISLFLLYNSLALVFPSKPLISLSATAFAALLPMHVAVTASLNNDVLAELLIHAAMLILLTWMKAQYEADVVDERSQWRLLLGLGVLCGLGLVTKIYSYVLTPILVLCVIVTIWRRKSTLWAAVLRSLWVAIPAALIGLPLWLRNLSLYGNWDVLALRWHDQVVFGQTTTAEYLTKFGWIAYSERALNFTFRSFWGVFGWLGVFMDERIYTACMIFTGVLFLGLLWAVVRFISGKPDTDMSEFQISVLLLFALIFLAVVVGYAWYNVKFVQHQGRYFFWGLLPISTAVALGWREVLQPLQGLITGVLGVILAASIFSLGFLGGDVDMWTVLTIVVITLPLMIQPLFRERAAASDTTTVGRWLRLGDSLLLCRTLGVLRWAVWAAPFALLFLLDLAIPFLFILPQLHL